MLETLSLHGMIQAGIMTTTSSIHPHLTPGAPFTNMD